MDSRPGELKKKKKISAFYILKKRADREGQVLKHSLRCRGCLNNVVVKSKMKEFISSSIHHPVCPSDSITIELELLYFSYMP